MPPIEHPSSAERLTREAPTLLFGAVLAAAVALLIALMARLTFFQDTWAYLMHRRDFTLDSFVQPHNEHIVVIPVAIQKLLLALFGMSSALPEQLMMVALLAAAATLLFVYVRRRLGAWPALFAATLLLFLGPAWQVLLWPFEDVFVGSVLCGLAALLALDAKSRRGDVLASAFLVLAVLFSSLGVPFGVAAAVRVWQERGERGLLSRLYVPAAAAAVYALWWLGWGSDADTHLSLRNVLDSPLYLFEGLAASLESLLGLSTISIYGEGEPAWGRPLLVALLVVVAAAAARGRRIPAGVWPIAAATAVYWLLAAFNYIPSREAYSSRYMYAGAVLVLLLAAELLRGVRLGRGALTAAGAVTVVAVISNLGTLRDGRDWLYEQTAITRGDLAAIEIARATVDPAFRLVPPTAGTPSLIDVEAGNYLAAAEEHGSPAYTEEELLAAPEPGRKQADIVLSQILPLSTETFPGRPGGGGECVEVGYGDPATVLGPGTTRIEVPPGEPAKFSLRRFAREGFPVKTEGAEGDTTTLLNVPEDLAQTPWRLRVEAAQGATVCRK